MNQIKIAVMTPKYADYDKPTKNSINKAIKKLPQIEFVFVSISEVYIHAARRKLLQKALELDPTYFFWLDSDIEFTSQHILNLMHLVNTKQFVSGIYFSRHDKRNPMICYGNIETGFDWILPKNWTKISPFIVDGCGFGFVLMSKKFVLDYTKAYPQTDWFQSNKWYPANSENPEWVVGEDLHFCLNAKKIGYSVWVDPQTVLIHKGIQYKDYINNKNEKPHCEPIIENFVPKLESQL